MRLISVAQVTTDYLKRVGSKDSYKARYEALEAAFDNAPIINAEPIRHGQWDANHNCTNCKSSCTKFVTPTGTAIYVETPYCPACGAKMDEPNSKGGTNDD